MKQPKKNVDLGPIQFELELSDKNIENFLKRLGDYSSESITLTGFFNDTSLELSVEDDDDEELCIICGAYWKCEHK